MLKDLKLETFKKLIPAYTVLVFYLIVMVVTGTIGYVVMKDKERGFSYGVYAGVAISAYLWFNYGKKYVK